MNERKEPYLPDDLKFDGEMTLRQYAAIKLRVPDSGTEWLDDMIRKSLRNEFAAKALPAVYSDLWEDVRAGRVQCVPEGWRDGVAVESYKVADAMIKASMES